MGQIATLTNPKEKILAAWIQIDGNAPDRVAREINKMRVDPCIANFRVFVRQTRQQGNEIMVIVRVDDHEFYPDQMAFQDFAAKLRDRGHTSATYPLGTPYDANKIYNERGHAGWRLIAKR